MTDETKTVVEPIDHPVDPKAKHRILVTFDDDHSIGSVKVEVASVTPEQIAVAVFHLTRTANQLADVRMMRSPQGRIAIARDLSAIQDEMGRRQ